MRDVKRWPVALATSSSSLPWDSCLRTASRTSRYYRAYIRLMNHWDRVLPGVVLRVEHETVVDDLEGSIRRLLEYCGLSFEAECLAYHETARSVNTASSEQVRRPIYREGLDQWRNYEPWLQPLRDALQLAGAE